MHKRYARRSVAAPRGSWPPVRLRAPDANQPQYSNRHGGWSARAARHVLTQREVRPAVARNGRKGRLGPPWPVTDAKRGAGRRGQRRTQREARAAVAKNRRKRRRGPPWLETDAKGGAGRRGQEQTKKEARPAVAKNRRKRRRGSPWQETDAKGGAARRGQERTQREARPAVATNGRKGSRSQLLAWLWLLLLPTLLLQHPAPAGAASDAPLTYAARATTIFSSDSAAALADRDAGVWRSALRRAGTGTRPQDLGSGAPGTPARVTAAQRRALRLVRAGLLSAAAHVLTAAPVAPS